MAKQAAVFPSFEGSAVISLVTRTFTPESESESQVKILFNAIHDTFHPDDEIVTNVKLETFLCSLRNQCSCSALSKIVFFCEMKLFLAGLNG